MLWVTAGVLSAETPQVVVEKKAANAPNGNELALVINTDGMTTTRATRFVRVDGRVMLVSAEKAVAIKKAQPTGTSVAVK
ncbi:MAG: hypothetical protein B9S32_15125 [Verrucomicrobia bacterium Tous-C9LFEB]|nr:MAG: hypothetical protein B9S32_15125 [Verrucomicrobia bacterium Tous-C9LFEB]